MILADYHCHTSFSTDSKAKPEDMISQAASLGLKRLCITDHMDYLYPSKKEGEFSLDPTKYYARLFELKEMFKDKIELLFGIELGLRNEPKIRANVRNYYTNLLKEYNFDFVIGSTHVLENMDPYLKEYWVNHSAKDGITAYFQSIIDNCNYYDGFQVYGHLDYIVRYIPDDIKEYDYNDYKDLIDIALKSILSHGKGIECNASGLKYGLNTPHPKPEILKRYKELGGEILTIGSDAHKPEYIAHEFNKVRELLLSLGFRYYTIYKNKKPEFIRL